jgi:tetratricopeptide (TPR) repeat protein
VALPARAQLFGVECDQADYTDAATNYSLYSENFKNEAYVDALPNLRWIVDCEPNFMDTARRNFDRLETIYLHFAENATSGDEKAAYLDSVMIVRDYKTPILEAAGIEIDEHAATIAKGRFIQTHLESLPGRGDEVVELYMQAFEMNPEATDSYTVQYLLSHLATTGQVDETLEMVASVRPRFVEDTEMTGFLDQIQLAVLPTPEALYEFRQQQLEADPENEELILQVFELADDLDDTAMIVRLKPQILTMDPSYGTLRMLARISIDEANNEEAIDLLNRALALADSDDAKRDVYYQIGALEAGRGRLSAARSAYRQALEVDPNHGLSLIGIGDLYVTAVGNCGSFELNDRAVYILAVDYYTRAASDDRVADAARQKAGSYRRYFPTKEQVFFRNLQPGSSYTISGGCYGWIGERTTLRTSD